VREAEVRELIDEHAVDFLGHRAVEVPQAGLDVRDRNSELGGGKCSSEGRVDIARNDDQLRLLHLKGFFDADERASCLGAVRARTDAERIVRNRKPELVEEHIRHRLVVVLACVDDDMARRREPLRQRSQHRRRLHEVRTRAEHVRNTRCPRHQSQAISGRRSARRPIG
jgi:hypothetical protein